MLQGQTVIQREDARKIAAVAAGISPSELKDSNDEEGNMPSYGFTADNVDVDVYKRQLTACPEKSRQLLSLLNVSEMELKQLIRELTATDYITMNENEIESFRNRLTGLKNFSNSPGGFSEELALETMKELFLK